MPNSIPYSDLEEILWNLCDEAINIALNSENEGLIQRFEFYYDAYQIVLRRIKEYNNSHFDNYFVDD